MKNIKDLKCKISVLAANASDAPKNVLYANLNEDDENEEYYRLAFLYKKVDRLGYAQSVENFDLACQIREEIESELQLVNATEITAIDIAKALRMLKSQIDSVILERCHDEGVTPMTDVLTIAAALLEQIK